MKYTKEQRLDIGRQVYDREMSVDAAAVQYGLNPSSIKGYVRLYRAENSLPPRTKGKAASGLSSASAQKKPSLEEYEAMSKEELIDALVMARINEARLKKGYSVKGSGVEKEFLPIGSRNTR